MATRMFIGWEEGSERVVYLLDYEPEPNVHSKWVSRVSVTQILNSVDAGTVTTLGFLEVSRGDHLHVRIGDRVEIKIAGREATSQPFLLLERVREVRGADDLRAYLGEILEYVSETIRAATGELLPRRGGSE